MRDIDFIRPGPRPERLVIYRYKEGAFRTAMKRAIAARYADTEELSWVSGDSLQSHLSGLTLFDPLPAFAHDMGTDQRHLQGLSEAIAADDMRLVALFVDESNESIRDVRWHAIEAGAVVVHEVRPSNRNVRDLLAAFSLISALPPVDITSGEIARFFLRMIAEGADLNALKTTFEMLSVLGPAAMQDDLAKAGPRSLSACLREVVQHNSSAAVDEFIIFVDRLLRSRRAKKEVLRMIWRVTVVALRSKRVGGPGADDRLRWLFWSGELLRFVAGAGRQWEKGHVRPPDNFLETLRGLVSDLPLVTIALAPNSWRLPDLSPGTMLPMAIALADEVVSAVDRVASAPHWAMSLRSVASAISKPPVGAVAAPMTESRVRDIEEFVGNPLVVAQLRNRLLSSEPLPSIVLHGPSGIGKHTLAKIIAKQLLCSSRERGLACNACSSCRAFASGAAPISYIPRVDLSRSGADEALRFVVEKIRGGSVDGQVVAVLDRVDECVPEAFDVLLKTLERPPESATVIMLADNLAKMRQAGLSRSAVYRLKPLSEAESRQLVAKLLEEADVSGEAVAILVELGTGLPGRLINVARSLAGLARVEAEDVRARTGPSWMRDVREQVLAAVLDAWRPAVSGSLDQQYLPRVQIVWAQLGPSGRGTTSSALWGGHLAEAKAALVHVARELGVEPNTIWRATAANLIARTSWGNGCSAGEM